MRTANLTFQGLVLITVWVVMICAAICAAGYGY